jgi:hypothetical protein
MSFPPGDRHSCRHQGPRRVRSIALGNHSVTGEEAARAPAPKQYDNPARCGRLLLDWAWEPHVYEK